jgi:hypothetical protein
MAIHSNSGAIHEDLRLLQKFVFDKVRSVYTSPTSEPESSEYVAFAFLLDESTVRFRCSKITPTKVGQFVTLWKRKKNGPIQPFELSDQLDLVIIASRMKNHLGYFLFPKSVLHEKGIISGRGKEGKRAMRVYPPWNKTESPQAQKTQKWQLEYFLELAEDGTIDQRRAKSLLTPSSARS